MSFFKKILISTEMSSKIEVIVPEHRADNSSWLQPWEEFCEDLLLCVSPERHGDINGWKSGYTNKVNIDSLEVFLFSSAPHSLQSVLSSCLILTEKSEKCHWLLQQKKEFFFCIPFNKTMLLFFFLSNTARYFSSIDNLKADSISVPCTLLVIHWWEYHSTF